MRGIRATIVVLLLGLPSLALAGPTDGTIEGQVLDRTTGAPVAGATIVARHAGTGVESANLSDDSGRYDLPALAPGAYTVSAFYANVRVDRHGVLVGAGKTIRLLLRLEASHAEEQSIVVEERTPDIDLGSTRFSTTVTRDYIDNVPTAGRDYQDLLGAGVSTQRDQYGTGFAGATSVENRILIDGIDVTDIGFNRGGSRLLLPFLEEAEIISGGYNAEYGRGMGGLVNAVVRSGTNAWHAAAFSTLQPLELKRDLVGNQGQPLRFDRKLRYTFDLGANAGGPVVADKVFAFVGFAAVRQSDRLTRVVQRFVDRDQDGTPDTDPTSGFAATEETDRDQVNLDNSAYQWVGKVDLRPMAGHSGSITWLGTIGSAVDNNLPGLGGSDAVPFGTLSSSLLRTKDTTSDLGGHWTSTFHNNALQLDGWASWHAQRRTRGAALAEGNQAPVALTGFPGSFYSLDDLSAYGERRHAGCVDGGSADPYPKITNCALTQPFQVLGKSGTVGRQDGDRINLRGAVTGRVQAAGHHQLKAGADIELDRFDTLRGNGSSPYNYNVRRRLVGMDSAGLPVYSFQVRRTGFYEYGKYEAGCDPATSAACLPNQLLTGGLHAGVASRHLALFAQDSWFPIPNLTINAGLRVERQTLRWADEFDGKRDPVTGEAISGTAIDMPLLVAPRVGALYDFTGEGRSKVFGHYGRFYQAVPLGTVMRVFGGEILRRDTFNASQCGAASDGEAPPNPIQCSGDPAASRRIGDLELIMPGLRSTHVQEVVLGAEYSPVEDVTVGATFLYRTLVDGLEDFSLDNASTYIWGNPGEKPDADEIARLGRLADRIAATDPERARVLRQRIDWFNRASSFPKPRREFTAVQLQARKRFSKGLLGPWLVQGWYQYSRTFGNFPGQFSPDTGQLDPNISSLFDLISLLGNRDGALPQDRPHSFRVDGAKVFVLAPGSELVLGGSSTGRSGTPINAAGAHPAYGQGEAFLLPRGTSGRTEFAVVADLRVSYRHKLGDWLELEAFADTLNLFDLKPTVAVDNNYTFESTNPIVDGRDKDLRHAKVIDPTDPFHHEPVTPNKNWKQATVVQNPTTVRFGLQGRF